MPTRIIKCCITGCQATGVHQHRFPNPKKDLDRFNTWLRILNMEELRSLSSATVYTNKRVCSAHFESKYKSPGNPRLHINAIPTLEIIDSLPSTSAESMNNPSTSRDESDSMRNTGLLKSVSVLHEKELTPKAKSLYRSARYWKRTSNRMKMRKISFQERLAAAERFTESDQFIKMSVLTPSAKIFVEMQSRETKNKNRARRFTKQEKILSLTLYKNSPKNYDLLHKLFTLPSKKTLNEFLRRLQLNTGINRQLFNALKKNVSKLRREHRMCILMFDEISIAAHLEYCAKSDLVQGFVDNGLEREAALADHALVFMVRGIIKQWKQAISYTFCKSFTKSTQLGAQIKNIIKELQEIGLEVVATVCDQARSNEAAINYLKNTTQVENMNDVFIINKKPVVPLFDVPHLFKGIRNNMLKKEIKVTIGGRNLHGKWEHIVQLYNIDKKKEIQELRLLPKLTEGHIFPNSRQKMKVKLCTQVFSQRVAAVMRHIAVEEPGQIDEEAEQTAIILLFLDKLFDSLNSSSLGGKDGKPYTAALSATSPHVKFWDEALDVLRSMKFVSSNKSEEVPPSLKNLKRTIEGMKYIWKKMNEKKIKFLFTRNFNQDPLENYFGQVRNNGFRNVNPTVTNFVQAFKTLTINNFSAKHSLGANCEEDVSDGALNTLGELLDRPDEPLPPTLPTDFEKISSGNISYLEDSLTYKKSSYCAGFILKNLKNVTKGCSDCNTDLFATNIGIQHGLIAAREYDSVQRLIYPTFSATNSFIDIKRLTIEILKENLHVKNIVFLITEEIMTSVSFDYLSCENHKKDLLNIIVKKTIMFILNTYIKEKNDILKGKKKIGNDIPKDKFQLLCINKYNSSIRNVNKLY